MERSRVFEAVLVVLFIGLAGLLYLAITSPAAPVARSWEVAGNGTIDYMLVGEDDTLYAFSGNSITAVKIDGSTAWALDVPAQWRVLNTWMIFQYSLKEGRDVGSYGTYYKNMPIVDERSGTIYLFVPRALGPADIPSATKDASPGTIVFPSKLMAITPEGDVAWEYNFTVGNALDYAHGLLDPRYSYWGCTVAIKSSGDRVYLFHDYSEDVLDRDGRLLFTIRDVFAPVSMDDRGHIYSVGTYSVDSETFEAMAMNKTYIGLDMHDGNITLPSSTVSAFDPNGSLLWRRDIGENAVRPPLAASVWQEYNSLPLYANDTLYVPLSSGVAALDTDGNMEWISHLSGDTSSLFGLMPVDEQGNVYLEKLDLTIDNYFLGMIAPDGNVSGARWDFTRTGHSFGYFKADYPIPVAGNDGVVYAIGSYPAITDQAFDDAMSTLQYGADTIEAIDLKGSGILWKFDIPLADRHAVTLNESNVDVAIRNEDYGGYPPAVDKDVQVYPGDGVTYVSYDFAIYDSPVTYNVSRCFYARGVYALDSDGLLIWEIHPDGFVDRVAAGNGTIYYFTSDGQLGAGTVSVAAGFALAALAYFFLRFFMLGTVTRARSRLEQNENRNAVLRFVADNPGATAADAVKGLGMNTGTIRYHLFILTLNHKIATHKEDDKYLRYFRNAGAYTETERSLVSLLRREPLRRTLEAIARNPGLSGSGLARELNLSATAANRHVATLAEKGIIEQVPVPEKGYGYVIKAEHLEMIGRLMARL